MDWEAEKSYRGWSDGTLLYRLSKMIVGYLITNSKPTIGKEESLTDDMRQKLYDWVISYVWPSISDKVFFKHDLQLLYLIFDKTKLYQYVDQVKGMKSNYEYTANSDGKRVSKTLRYMELKPTLEYLMNPYYYDISYYVKNKKIDVVKEYSDLITHFVSGIVMGVKERSSTIESLVVHQNNYYKETIDALNKITEKIFNVNIIFHSSASNSEISIRDKTPIKESVVTNYNRFIGLI
jgi:hypothetical protein